MRLGGRTTADALSTSIIACLKIAEQYHLESIAFPAIGTGIAGFPIKQCAEIMLKIFMEKTLDSISLKKIYVVLYDSEAYNIVSTAYKELVSKGSEK
jgi:O-acetyl-ADP-ribose deacetylase (regulator of RNase III)